MLSMLQINHFSVENVAEECSTRQGQMLKRQLSRNEMTFSADLVIDSTDIEDLRISLQPELLSSLDDGCVTVTQEDNKMTIHITSDDISELRAILNSYLRWLDTADRTRHTLRRWKNGSLTKDPESDSPVPTDANSTPDDHQSEGSNRQ